MSKLFAGIDVAKDTSSAQGIDSNGKGRFSLTFSMAPEGFMQLGKTIAKHSKDLTEVPAAVESTACYHINLYSFLTAKGVATVVVNPLLIANFMKFSLRKTKTDKKDAMSIVQFLLAHRDSITQLQLSQDLQDFRDIARKRESLGNMIVAHRVEIKRLLQSTFPELERIGNLAPRVMQDFIPEFPSARLVKTAKELILRGKVRTLQHLQERHGELTKILTEYCKSSMLEDSEIMTSIDGVNRRTATTFLAEIGCIGSYASHKKLIALAGIDPTVYQSGKFEGKSRISKRGNQHLRRVIWLMTVCVIQHNNTFRTCLMKKIGARASRSRRQYLQRCINSYG